MMVRFSVVALFLLWGFVFPLQQPSTGDQIALAQAAYERGDYPAAIQAYNSLLQAGYRDGSLYFDLASAYDQSGDLGNALLNDLRARQFIPRDTTLNQNIARIRATRIDIQGDQSSLLFGIGDLAVSVATVNEWLWLVWIFLLVECVLISSRIAWPRFHASLLAPIIGCGVMLLLCFILLGSRLIGESLRPAAVITQDKVSAMSGPGEKYLELFDLHTAAEVRVVETRVDWVWVELPDGRQCWLPADALDPVN